MEFKCAVQSKRFITGQKEREETTQDIIVTKSAAFASYEINYLTYITATYTRAKRRWQHQSCNELNPVASHTPRFLTKEQLVNLEPADRST